MAKSRDCPICGGQIMFTYVRPDFEFYIEGGKIKRDTNTDLWHGKNPYLEFHCTNDRTHDLNQPALVDPSLFEQQEWEEDVENEFYATVYHDL